MCELLIDNDYPLPVTEGDKITAQSNAFDALGAITIDDVPLPTEARKHKIDKSTKRVIDRYNAAYKKLYGVPAHVEYTAPWIKVSGHGARITKARLLEMARQLEYRAG